MAQGAVKRDPALQAVSQQQQQPSAPQQQHQQQRQQLQLQQQQQMQQQRPQTPLDRIQNIFNFILLQTGQVLDPQNRDPQARVRMQSVVPQVIVQLHDNLDRLEDEISRAKAIMRRDYALFQAARERRLQEEAAEKERLEAAKLAPEPTSPVTDQEAIDSSALETAATNMDTEMKDVFSGVVAESENSIPDESKPTKNGSDEGREEGQLGIKAADEKKGDHVSPTATTSVSQEPNTKSPPTASEIHDIDFGSMFDMTGESENGNDPTSGDLAELTSFNVANGDDVSSLLPGLESYANIPDTAAATSNTLDTDLDLSVLGLPEQSDAANPQVKEGDAEASVDPVQETSEVHDDVMVNTSFDDLFNYDFEADPGNQDAGGNNGGEFEDAWISGFVDDN